MEDSLFTKIDESFVCENCGRKVEKGKVMNGKVNG